LVCSFQLNFSYIVHLSSFSFHAEEKRRKDEEYKKSSAKPNRLYYIIRYATENYSSFFLDHLGSEEKFSQKEWQILHFFKRKIRVSPKNSKTEWWGQDIRIARPLVSLVG